MTDPARREAYRAHLASEAWSAMRRRVLDRDGHRCQDCGATRRLHVHHLTYRNFGHEPHYELLTVCEDCHDARHGGWWERGLDGRGGWDGLGSDTAWRDENHPELRQFNEYHIIKGWPLTELEESYFAVVCYGPFGGDDQEMLEAFEHAYWSDD